MCLCSNSAPLLSLICRYGRHSGDTRLRRGTERNLRIRTGFRGGKPLFQGVKCAPLNPIPYRSKEIMSTQQEPNPDQNAFDQIVAELLHPGQKPRIPWIRHQREPQFESSLILNLSRICATHKDIEARHSRTGLRMRWKAMSLAAPSPDGPGGRRPLNRSASLRRRSRARPRAS